MVFYEFSTEPIVQRKRDKRDATLGIILHGSAYVRSSFVHIPNLQPGRLCQQSRSDNLGFLIMILARSYQSRARIMQAVVGVWLCHFWRFSQGDPQKEAIFTLLRRRTIDPAEAFRWAVRDPGIRNGRNTGRLCRVSCFSWRCFRRTIP